MISLRRILDGCSPPPGLPRQTGEVEEGVIYDRFAVMAADITVRAQTVSSVRRRLPTFGLSWRILGLVVVAVMTAEILLFLPSIARFRLVYLEQLIESGTLAALALDATPDNMVTEEVKRALLNNARVDAVVLVEPNKPKRALMNIEPRPSMPSYNLTEEGVFPLIDR